MQLKCQHSTHATISVAIVVAISQDDFTNVFFHAIISPRYYVFLCAPYLHTTTPPGYVVRLKPGRRSTIYGWIDWAKMNEKEVKPTQKKTSKKIAHKDSYKNV